MLSPLKQTAPSHFAILLVATGLLAIGLAGCDKDSFRSSKNIPAGLRDVAPTTFKGKVARAWGGDNFEVGENQQLHYFFLIGVDCPEPGQPFYDEARNYLLNTCSDREVEMEVLRYDEFKREVGHGWVNDADGERVNLAIELLTRGFAWYDQNEFEGSDRYREAMETARSKKLGLWSQSDPTPPWEHWQNTEDAISGKKTK